MNAVILTGLALMSLSLGCRGQPAAPRFVGSERCAGCHEREASAWRSSQHAVAMQPATPRSVLARFTGTFTYEGVASAFGRRGDRYFVETEGEDGRAHRYDIAYTFGVYPLQQYLVQFPGGRLQALSLAWDARPAVEGGQRWFFLFPGSRITHTDELHWTGRLNNWNYMCADCHSTAVRKGYFPQADTFHTTRAEISVGCEGCHGPGSVHARWPGSRWLRRITGRDVPTPAHLPVRGAGRWVLDSGSRIARQVVRRRDDREIDTCAQCHARRFHIADGYTAGKPFLDYYIPMLLERGQYWPDGQQLEEVYTYGTFLQSRMYAAGVTCSDCHDPHTGKLRKPGNQVCGECHASAVYDTPRHHFHAKGSPSAQCTACHMPTQLYMVVDARHDHGMRVPHPDRSAVLGTPDPCTGCHKGKSAEWAAHWIRQVRPRASPDFQRFAEIFAADEASDSGSARGLVAIANDRSQPMIVRASAIARLADYPDGVTLADARRWAIDPSPLVRLAVLQVVERWGAPARFPLAARALMDSTRAVRQAAAWLVAADTSLLGGATQRRAFARAAAEFTDSQRYNADQPESRLSLGVFLAALGRLAEAEGELRAATRIAPRNATAWLALSRVQRRQGRSADATRTLRDGLARVPGASILVDELQRR